LAAAFEGAAVQVEDVCHFSMEKSEGGFGGGFLCRVLDWVFGGVFGWIFFVGRCIGVSPSSSC
jgi:hypothetical protein